MKPNRRLHSNTNVLEGENPSEIKLTAPFKLSENLELSGKTTNATAPPSIVGLREEKSKEKKELESLIERSKPQRTKVTQNINTRSHRTPTPNTGQTGNRLKKRSQVTGPKRECSANCVNFKENMIS